MRRLLGRAKTRSRVFQILVLLFIAGLICMMGLNAASNLEKQGIASGFGFLEKPAGFGIIQHLIDYSESSTYLTAFIVSLLNTLILAFLGILLASVLGFLIGIARLSSNWLVAKLSSAYIEIFRNIPLLLQIFFWYFAVLRALPSPRESFQLFDSIFLNIRGLYLPIGSTPVLQGFNFEGGVVIIPELIAMLLALSVYTASFIAEIVRAGILSVSKGQVEAANALGLKQNIVLRKIIIPQALRVIIPPLTSQYLNLTKNSSLAAAIAYPELVSVFAGTVLNQTGQAIEVIGMTMAVYLTISLTISLLMNLYNKRVKC